MGLGDKIFSGLVWSVIEKLSIQVMQFVIGIVLARLLTPKEYGIIGLLIVFIAISKVFINSGFTQALVQKQDRTAVDISSVFYVNIIISVLCYILLFFCSGIIARYYEIELLESLLQVLAISLVINSLFAVPATLLTIEMNFKVLTKVNLTSTLISGTIAIFMAYNGYGVWALVAQTLIRSVINSSIIWLFIKWKPQFKFSLKSIKSLFKFGSNLLVGSLLNTIVNNFYALVIAKVISTKDLGYYTRGTQFSDVIFSFVNTAMGRVLFPGLSTIQNDIPKLVLNTRKIIKMASVIVVPIFFFLCVMSEPIIRVLLTEKWLPAVPIMQFFCIARLITILSGINVNLLYVIGKTNLALRQQYLKIIIRVVFFFIFLKYGIVYIALAELLSTIVHFFINTYYPGKLMQYGAFSQIKDMGKIFLAGILMTCIPLILLFYISNDWLLLITSSLSACFVYLICIKILKIKELDFIKEKAFLFLKIKK